MPISLVEERHFRNWRNDSFIFIKNHRAHGYLKSVKYLEGSGHREPVNSVVISGTGCVWILTGSTHSSYKTLDKLCEKLLFLFRKADFST